MIGWLSVSMCISMFCKYIYNLYFFQKHHTNKKHLIISFLCLQEEKRKRRPTAKGAAIKVQPTVAILKKRELLRQRRAKFNGAKFNGLSNAQKADLKTVSAWLFVVVYV